MTIKEEEWEKWPGIFLTIDYEKIYDMLNGKYVFFCEVKQFC